MPASPPVDRRPQLLVMLLLAAAGVALRWWFVDFESGDFRTFLSRWYAHLQATGHLAGLRDDSFSNYNTPYLVLLALAGYLPVSALAAVKAISIGFDLLLAWAGSRIVARLRPASAWPPVGAFALVLALPTVAMNSGVWGQCDSIYATFCLLAVLALVDRRPWAAPAWWGVAFAFKLQAVFLLPLLVAVLIVNRHRLAALSAAVASFLACLVPALVAGRSLLSQLLVYQLQATDSSGIGGTVGGAGGPAGRPPGGAPRGGAPPGGAGGPPPGGGFTLNDGQSFTHNAPTPYAWLDANAPVGWKYAGLALTAGVVIAFGVWLLARRRRLGATGLVFVAAASSYLIPLLLPEMHERYFYLAEVLTVLAAFADWRWVLPAAAIQTAGVTTYLAYLLDHSVFPLRWAAGIALAGGLAAAALLVAGLARDRGGHATTPPG